MKLEWKSSVALFTEKDRKEPKRTEKGPKRTEKDRKGTEKKKNIAGNDLKHTAR